MSQHLLYLIPTCIAGFKRKAFDSPLGENPTKKVRLNPSVTEQQKANLDVCPSHDYSDTSDCELEYFPSSDCYCCRCSTKQADTTVKKEHNAFICKEEDDKNVYKVNRHMGFTTGIDYEFERMFAEFSNSGHDYSQV